VEVFRVSKKTIQVPIDEILLHDLDLRSKKESVPRAVLIRKACKRYLDEVERRELERQCVEGYQRIPESTDIGETQTKMLPGEW
jgi:metal-responsive CopG/Arc/MetJ family transcriptional regulator